MNQEAYAAISKMINAFPQSAGNLKALLLTYEEDLTGVSDLAIVETAARYRRNEIPEQNRTFAPSVAEFVTSARNQHGIIEARQRPRLPPPPIRRGPLAPFEVAKQQTLAKYAGRPVLVPDATLDQFRRMSRAGELPEGATWVAIIGIVGPEPKNARAAA